MFQEELLDLLKARQAGIWVRTTEEKEAVLAIKNAIDMVAEYDNIYTWSMNEGIKQIVLENNTLDYIDVNPNPGLAQLAKMIAESNTPFINKSRVWVLKDYHLSLAAPQSIRIIRDLKESPIAKYTPIIVVSPSSEIPQELEKIFKILEYPNPTEEEIKDLINNWILSKNVELKDHEITILSKRLFGFTRSEILSMLNLSYVKYKKINLDIINEKKIDAIKDSGLLDYKIPTITLKDVGGNDNFKKWYDVVEACMTNDAREYGIPSPKGYLSVGVPGSSKTLTAEAIAGKDNLPFIKLNMARINSRYAGETERNMRKALNLVKSCAPCVFLIDEVEKALGGIKSSNSSDSGAIARAFGLVLEFLNDNNNGVFVVMTSNDVSQLPPELTRAGRLDAIWYFGLPSLEERKQIFKVHFDKINKEVSEETLNLIAQETKKYTGAEIELVVKSALRKAYLQKVKTGIDKGITYELLMEAIKEVIPVAVSSKEQILSLERWAENRALFANNKDTVEVVKKKVTNLKPLSLKR